LIAEPQLIEFKTIDSTNTEAHRRAAAGECGPLWIRSDVQEQGRGRSGRPWASPAGNFSATLLFAPGCPRNVLHQLSFVAGLAGHDAIAHYLDGAAILKLKWPNDLLVDGAKVSGILVESSIYADEVVVMIGMGINIGVTPPVSDRAVTRMKDHGAAPAPGELLRTLADAMARWLTVWNRGEGFATIRAAWTERAHPIGEALFVNTNQGRIEGTFQGLDADGALLLVLPSQETTRVEHGDVSLVTSGNEERA